MSNIILKVNGKNYGNWTSLSIRRSVDEFSGSFSFESTDTLAQDYPIRDGDAVQVLVNGTAMVTGFVDEIYASISGNDHNITVRGRDNVRNLIDTSIPNDWKQNVSADSITSFEQLCSLVIQGTGNDIALSNVAGTISPFEEDELQEAETGQKAMQFLSSFARKRNVYLNTDGKGVFRIYRPQSVNATDDLLLQTNSRRNNIKSRRYRHSSADRFRTVNVRSQEDSGGGAFDFEAPDASGTATDTEISTGRTLEIISEEEMTAAECEERAKEEVNIRRARATEYTCVVAGAVQSDGTPWDYGLTARLVDDKAGIQGRFFIRSVEISRTIDNGTNTTLTLVPPDAYKVKSELTATDKRVASLGTKYQQ